MFTARSHWETVSKNVILWFVLQKYNRVVQVGQWQRSDPHWQDAMQFVHSGQLGKIRTVRVFSYQGWCPSIPVLADEPVPAEVDYNMWLGPARKREFNRNRFPLHSVGFGITLGDL